MNNEKIRQSKIIQTLNKILGANGHVDDVEIDKNGSGVTLIIHVYGYGNRLPPKLLDILEQYGIVIDIRTHRVEGLIYPVFCLDFKPKRA